MAMQAQSHTSFDQDWDDYVDDFGTDIPDYLDIIDSVRGGQPGTRLAETNDYLLVDQTTAQGWYPANADLTVAESRRLKRIEEDAEEFLQKIG